MKVSSYRLQNTCHVLLIKVAVGLFGIVCWCCNFTLFHSPNLRDRIKHTAQQSRQLRALSSYRKVIARAATGRTLSNDTDALVPAAGAITAQCRPSAGPSATTTPNTTVRSALCRFLSTGVRSTRLCRFLGTEGGDGSMFSLSAIPVSLTFSSFPLSFFPLSSSSSSSPPPPSSLSSCLSSPLAASSHRSLLVW